ncbi:MAG: hypothetical protein HC897_20150 [Thermoanaerobaculia bacterium]|nr:hypothetical protein [Thermoanaerobaculia bacterium]
MRWVLTSSVKIAFVFLLLWMIPAQRASAGRLLATGHDADLHCGGSNQQCHFFEVAVRYVRGGAMNPTLPVLILDRLDLDAERALDRAFPPAGSVPREVVDPRSPEFPTLPIDPMKYSAVIVASTACGRCDLNEPGSTPDSDAINARAADFATFFNAGGGILALAGDRYRNVYYGFLPLPVGAVAVSGPFALTPDGIALGFEDSPNGIGASNDINCCQTHNSFVLPGPDSPIRVAELDNAGRAETIFAEGTIIDGEIVPPCLKPIRAKALCTTDGTGDYTLDVAFRNVSGDAVEHLFLVDPPGMTPDYFHFSRPIPPNGVRGLPLVRIAGAAPGPFTFQATLHNSDFEECCIGEITVELPPCDCAQVTSLLPPSCFFRRPRLTAPP